MNPVINKLNFSENCVSNSLNIDSFEYFFDEKILKKGLYLFERKRIKHADRSAQGEYTFIFSGKHQINLGLTINNNKISEYICSCKTKIKCEHLCAAIFYLNKNKLVLNKDEDTNKKNGEQIFIRTCKNLNDLIGNGSNAIKLFLTQNKSISPVILHLCIVNEFSKTHNFTDNSNNTAFDESLTSSLKHVKNLKLSSLKKEEKEALIFASKNCLKSNPKFNSGAFTFLIPLAAEVIDDKNDFEELKHVLNKRKLKQNYGHYLDLKFIAHLQLQLREHELLKKSNKAILRDLSPELSVTLAEREFYKGKWAQGFKSLKADYEKIKKNKPVTFIAYIEYIIDKAKKFKDNEVEIYFIKENLLFDSHISPKYLLRVKELLPENQRELYLNEIIKELGKKSEEFYFDKTAQILESESRWDELIRLISRHANRFSLLNKIAIKKLPAFDKFTLDTYMKQFVFAVSEARETFHQKQILEKALVYLNQLPEEVRIKLFLEILEKISKSNFIYRLLKKYTESVMT